MAEERGGDTGKIFHWINFKQANRSEAQGIEEEKLGVTRVNKGSKGAACVEELRCGKGDLTNHMMDEGDTMTWEEKV